MNWSMGLLLAIRIARLCPALAPPCLPAASVTPLFILYISLIILPLSYILLYKETDLPD